MHYSAYLNAEKFYNKYCSENIENKKILDVGSYDVNGTMKPIFHKGHYIGVDMEAGPNVDVVANAHELPFQNENFDIVLSSSCFEHDDMFWETFLEMFRVLKPGGYMYVQAPQNGPYHGWPGDNWRFYLDSWVALERWGNKNGYNIELVERYIDDTTPPPDYEGERIWNDSIGIFKKKEKIEYNFSPKTIEKGHHNFKYRGIITQKCPFDYVLYQMILNEIKPDLVIEIGTNQGGSCLYMADLMEINKFGEIHTIDIEDNVTSPLIDNHNRIKRFLNGYQNYDLNLTNSFERILIIDDGSHQRVDVEEAFQKFKDLVSVGSYYIIEDGVLTELGYESNYGGGPLKAIEKIIDKNKNFIIDRKWSNFFGTNATFNPNGFLKRIY
jgi:cephalosporin hydroxylase